MHICFINKKSRLRGPFDIMDAQRRKVIHVGDIILHETLKEIEFLIVVSEINKWGACKLIGHVEGNLNVEGNVILFSFNGLSRRYGNIDVLKQLKVYFDTSPFVDFFNNALAILEDKCDLWDVGIFKSMYGLSPFMLQERTKSKQEHGCGSNSSAYLFERYLTEDALVLFYSLVGKNIQMRNVYKEVREKYPEAFRYALKVFLQEHPNSTIYEKI